MLATLFLVLAAALPAAEAPAATPPAEVWRPMYSFLGTWKGAGVGPAGALKVTRSYASSPTNHHIDITESVDGRSPAAPWGTVSWDPASQALVLRRLAVEGAPGATSPGLALDPAASTAERLVFVSAGAAPARTRVTYERAGWNAFVERVERADSGAAFTVLAETRFARKD